MTSNCTIIIFDPACQIAPALPLDCRLLLCGHYADYAYEQGALASRLPSPRLRAPGYIKACAQAAGGAYSTAFSQAIRAGIPGAGAQEPQ